ncbi:Vacuolar protein sorting-associated protein 53, partial [Coemansia sp. RSA 2618]
ATAEPLDALRRACLVANTADYCASAAAQLEQKIVEKVDEPLGRRVTFAASRDALLGAINASINTLISGVEAMCAPAFSALAAAPWHAVQTVGDQSEYVLLIASAVDAAVMAVRAALSGPRYFRSFCDKLAARVSERYLAAIVQCGRISEVGAEQLLLDAQALKSVLLHVPAIGADGHPEPPPAYTRVVALGVGRIEALLKAILVPSDPADALVGRFLLLFPAAPRDVFRQVLELKGIKHADHPGYVRVLQQHQRQSQDERELKKELKQELEKEPQGQNEEQSQNRLQSQNKLQRDHQTHAFATPDPRSSSLPLHEAGRAPASAPLVSRAAQPRTRVGEHSRAGSMVFDTAHPLSPETHHAGRSNTDTGHTRMLHEADPLGITASP